MKKIFTITLLFVLALAAGIQLRNKNIEQVFEKSELVKDDEREEKGKHADHPDEFIKFHLGIRTRSDETKPSYPDNYQMLELQKAKHYSAKRKSNIAARSQSGANGVIGFTERGPSNVPGRTRGLIVDPGDATHKTWYAGSAGGGIWKTTDAGATWQWLTLTLPNMATTTLAMAASNHNILYAGTGEGFGNLDGIAGTGVFKSIDRGVNWTFLANSTSLSDINRLAIDPSDANIVLAATNTGIYRSIDGGANWTKVYNGLGVQDLRATPGNFSILYAGKNGVGVLKSTDSGQNWVSSNTGMAPKGRIEIDVSPVNSHRIIASTQGALSGGSSDLYVSDDDGTTWSLVTLSLVGKTVDYLASSGGDQGWYDNTVTFSPYNQNVVYVGGIGTYQITLGVPTPGSTLLYSLVEINTSSFLSFVNFNASAAGGRLQLGPNANTDIIEFRFGPTKKQKAHRFTVPPGSTSGVPVANYSYNNYVDVDFEVWNVTSNKQLMVSFRDQNSNGQFDLINVNTTDPVATNQSREYVYVNNILYDPNAASPLMTIAGGQVVNEMYNIWPVLTSGGTWPTLSPSTLQITNQTLKKYSSTVSSVADVYSEYDGKNNRSFVHPDQHNIVAIKQNDVTQAYQLLMANDGGVYVSGISTSPGTTQGEWKAAGNGYNTSQFYGADKKPGSQQYLGGMQDNATYFTPNGSVGSATTAYSTSIPQLSGDGFEALWHTLDGNKMIGGSQNNGFSRSLDGGNTWVSATTGFSVSTNFPFISKLACSKQSPDVIYSVGTEGVWKSNNFGASWTLTPISTGWAASSFADVEISRANANVVWAGGGLGSSGNLFVSTNAGKTFAQVANPVAPPLLGNITKIATHPTNEKIAYALFSFAKTSKILMTTDLGQTWTDTSGFGVGTTSTNGFPDVAVYSLYVRPDNTNIVWAGTEIGIVESLDAGATWSLLTAFPSVAVWDMKGQDNEIVIATHGRGIWTATVPVDQNANFPVPLIVNSGTTPQSNYAIEMSLPYLYDSVQILINSQKLSFIPTATGSTIAKITNVQAGSLTVQLVGYIGKAPIYSLPKNDAQLKLTAYQKQYFDYFVNKTNFFLNNFSLQSWGLSNSSLQSQHSYVANQDASGTLLVPIIVSATNSSFSYEDVALVQPGAGNDYVVAEATKNGVTWTSIAPSYNSSANANWLTAVTANGKGDPSMSAAETFDLKPAFKTGDTLLIRFRLHANNDNSTGWGWSIDNLYVQQSPTGVEPIADANAITIYPNPTSGKFQISYFLQEKSEVQLNIWDMTGRNVVNQNVGEQQDGIHHHEINLDTAQDGIYLIRLRTNQGEKVAKVVLRK